MLRLSGFVGMLIFQKPVPCVAFSAAKLKLFWLWCKKKSANVVPGKRLQYDAMEL